MDGEADRDDRGDTQTYRPGGGSWLDNGDYPGGDSAGAGFTGGGFTDSGFPSSGYTGGYPGGAGAPSGRHSAGGESEPYEESHGPYEESHGPYEESHGPYEPTFSDSSGYPPPSAYPPRYSDYQQPDYQQSEYGSSGYSSPEYPPFETDDTVEGTGFGGPPPLPPGYTPPAWGAVDDSAYDSEPVPDRTSGYDRTFGHDRPSGFDRPIGYDRDSGYDSASDYDTGSHRRVEPAPEAGLRDLEPVRRFRRVDDDDDGEREEGRRGMPLWQELPLLLVVAFCLAVLIRTFLLQAFFIPSSSMEDTLLVGDRVLVNKIVYDVRTPARGEIVVFRGTESWAPENPPATGGGFMGRLGRTMGDLVGLSRPGEKDFIKRVIAVPGDRVSCCDNEGRVYVNGEALVEPYVKANSPLDAPPDPHVCRSRRFEEVLVPPGQVFVMGDHRVVSQDSRCQGPVPIENIIGRAFVIVWPSSRWGTLGVPDAFASVPGPVAIGPAGVTPSLPGVGVAVLTLPIVLAVRGSARLVRKRRWGRRTLRA